MARVSLGEDEAARALYRYGFPPSKYGHYYFQSRRVYERIDGKFIAIGWHIFKFAGDSTEKGIIVLDSELD